MNSYYDVQKAGALLKQTAESRSGQSHQLSTFDQIEDIEKYHCLKLEKPRTWKFIQYGSDAAAEEVVLRIQGVICGKDLPPISHPFILEGRQRIYVRQSVCLTGFGTKTFQSAINSIEQIHQKYTRSFPQGAFEDWAPSEFEGSVAIDIANRYFTTRGNAIIEDIIPFLKTVDPDGILAKGIDEKFVHTIENQVQYYEMIKDGQDSIRYYDMDPMKLRCGDIVEAQISFMVIELKNKRYKLILVLRTLTLLDPTPVRVKSMVMMPRDKKANADNKDATISRNRAQNQVVVAVSLKRKVGYSTDDIGDTRERITKMRIDHD